MIINYLQLVKSLYLNPNGGINSMKKHLCFDDDRIRAQNFMTNYLTPSATPFTFEYFKFDGQKIKKKKNYFSDKRS